MAKVKKEMLASEQILAFQNCQGRIPLHFLNKTIKVGDIAPDSSGTICLHGQMERFEQIEKKRTIK